ncbi:MAG: DUF3329 domain-containing protein [Acetobacterium sp.]
MDDYHFANKQPNSGADTLVRSKKANRVIFAGILVITFCYMLFLNIKTPLIADDYVYTFIFGTTTPLTNLGDIVISQWAYYLSWGGRLVAGSLTQLFLFWGKDVFNIINSLCYLVFILAIYFNGVGRKIRPEILLLVTILVWFCVPVFGQTVMWLTGASNYLWCGTLILLAILPFRLYAEQPTKTLKSIGFALIMGPLFFLSGITNENTAGGMILIMVLFCLLYYKRKIKIPVFAYTGIFFSICGYLIMILAPGNELRGENEIAVIAVTAIVGSNPFITRLSYFANNLYLLMPLIIIASIAFVFLRKVKEKKERLFFWIFVTAAAASMIVMLAPPKFPPRAMFGLAAFMIIAVVYALDQLELSKNRDQIKSFVFIPAAVVLIYFGMSLGYAGVDAITVSKQVEARISIIEKHKGDSFIEVSPIIPLTSHNGMYNLQDVQTDPDHWANRALADYYGISNIILKP